MHSAPGSRGKPLYRPHVGKPKFSVHGLFGLCRKGDMDWQAKRQNKNAALGTASPLATRTVWFGTPRDGYLGSHSPLGISLVCVLCIYS